MKAKIKRQHVYSVLFMRDDCGVIRFRLSGFWIKALVFLLALLLIGASLGGWGAYYFWNKHEIVKLELRELETVLSENRRHLERLANLEKILESNDPARIHTAMSSVAGPDTHGEANGAARGASSAQRTASGPPEEGDGDDAAAPEGNGGSGAGQSRPQQTPQGRAVVQPLKDHTVRLTNVSLRRSGNSRIQIAFDLNNRNDPSQPLSGRVYLSVVDADGNVTDILNADKNDLRFFQIQRYKTVRTTFALPTNVPLSAVREVQVTVETEGNPVYVERLPMPR